MKTLMLDISQSVYEGTGVARFTVSLATELAKLNKAEYQVSFLCVGLRGKIPDQILQACKIHNCNITRIYFPPKLLCRVWNGNSLIGWILALFIPKSDIFISSDWAQPPRHIAKFNITVVHDLIFKVYPQTVDRLVLQTQEARLKSVCANCDLVICDSQQTSDDFKKYYPDFTGQTTVIYPIVLEIENQNVKPPVHSNYILSVGKVEPRKNYARLIEAFHIARPQLSPDTKLVIVGRPGWGDVKITESEHVVWLQDVADAQLAALYKFANAFIMPSLYEGFGYPLVEAMQAGVPTAASNTSSLAELGGGGASLLFDPQDTGSIVDAIVKVYTDETLRNSLVAAANANLHKYTAENYLQQLKKVL